ncbi:MAG: diaminopimelate epimerase [Cyclobacteriaceae bacterium]
MAVSSISFYKYQGTGNDFVMIDNRNEEIRHDDLDLVRKLCDRRFGIGADGLILIQEHPSFDFEMIYFNADGSMSMCGNGARCAVMFAHSLNIISDKAVFEAIDGKHEAFITDDGLVHLKMGKSGPVTPRGTDTFIDTGSPHHIRFIDNLQSYDIVSEGRRIRYGEPYFDEGTNVNFVENKNGNVYVRTYERGVEGETYSCGTGVTAVALALSVMGHESPVKMKTKGGDLQVSFKTNGDDFEDVYLIGPAKRVFKGTISPEIIEGKA